MRKMLSADRWADVGVGSTVIFISMVLTATGAASIVLEQNGEVQTQASNTATEALLDVSKGLWVMQVLGHSDGLGVDRIEVYLKLQPGSQVMAMEEVMVQVVHGEAVMDLAFDAEKADSAHYRCSLALATSELAADWASLHVLGFKDVARMVITEDDGDLDLRSMEHVTMTFMPASGVVLEYGFTVPQVYHHGWFVIS